MNKRPKVSVLIPVYNVENYICDCMDSVVNQTFKDIEIVCVNDCSTDNSLAILKKYAEQDSRVVIVDKKQNEGLLMARKSGVEAATGEYILFVDSDDYIDLNLCQFVNDITSKEDADIIHFSFGAEVAYSDVDCSDFIAALKPYEKTLENTEVLRYAYIDRKYATSLVGKILKTDLCKKVYELLPDEHCYVGEDVFTYFFLAYFAKKYTGINTPAYYSYRYGLGVSGVSKISLSKFEMFCKMANWIKFTEKFLQDKTDETDAVLAAYNMKLRLFNDCCEIYRLRVSPADKVDALTTIYKYWHDVELDDNLWLTNTGKTKEYIKIQYENQGVVIKGNAFAGTMPKVSVVISANNKENCLEAFLESMENQSLKEIELIVLNDGSVDATKQIAKKHCTKDSRIIFIDSKNYGKALMWNKGLQFASGKYMYFTDVDSVPKLNMLEKLYSAAEEFNADIICSDVDAEFNDALTKEQLLHVFVKKGLYSCDMSKHLVRKDLFEKANIEFDSLLNNCEYLAFPLLLAHAGTVKTVSEKLTEYKTTDISGFGKDGFGFIECLKTYATLASCAVLNSYSDSVSKAVINEFSKKYYYLSKDIYMQLSQQDINFVNSELEDNFKPFLFSIRELRSTKQSMAYRIGDAALNFPKKIIGKNK